MALSLDRIRDRIATLPVDFSGETLNLRYVQGRITPEFFASHVHARRAADTLAALLRSWDLQDDHGAPLQPEDLADPVWDDRAREERVSRATRQRVQEASDQKRPVELLTDNEIAALRSPAPTPAERQAAYERAWVAILEQVPQTVLLTVIGAILEDVRPGK